MTCPEITMVVRTYQVCALTMVGQYSEIREHLQTFNVDYLGTSKMDISWLCSKHSIIN